MSESDGGANGPLRKRIKVDPGEEELDVATANTGNGNMPSLVNNSEPPALTASQQVLQQVNAQNAANPPSSSKSREVRLEQNRKAARESRRRKKVMVEELQRSVIFFSRANAFLKQQNDEYTRMLAQAQAAVQQQQAMQAQNANQPPQAAVSQDANHNQATDPKIEDVNSLKQAQPQQPTNPAPVPMQQLQQPQAAAPIQPQNVESTQQPQPVASAGPVSAAPISAEQAAQAQAVARAAAQQFAPQFAAMFGAAASPAQAQGATEATPTTNPAANAPTTPLQVAAANFQAAAAASLANGNILGTYPTAFPGSGPYADAFQNALFQQQAAAAAATGAAAQAQQNFAASIPMNFGGPFQQAALAQHFGQNMFPPNTMNNAAPVAANPAPSAPQTNNAPAPEPATAST